MMDRAQFIAPHFLAIQRLDKISRLQLAHEAIVEKFIGI